MPTPTVAMLHGDQTGEELLLQARRLLERDVIGFQVMQRDFDLYLAHRRETRNEVVQEASAALRECGFGIKAATITPEGTGAVATPKAIPREQGDGRGTVSKGRPRP